ncbi:MAG TPA: CDP-6-deoxy-delta-3,4-glucoseen reductase [Burkholderiales bacterium]|nr:CDP-6-deoxy-delta-3,4-glucoseen reductase [Burkholderiales bacterium]
MSFQVTIKPSDHVFAVESSESVLEAALRQGFGLPYGCRNGACGTCKGKILEGKVDYGIYQESALSEAEKLAGAALFCQAKPQTDLVIEAREINAVKDIQIRKLPCRVQKMERPADDVMVLYLKLPANERLQFLAGQYIDILMKEGKRRSFSMANPPHDDECLQLHVRNIAGGAFTDYVFNKMKEREILRFEGPLGTFFLREDSDKPIIFVASGTGFAPIKGIIEHAFYKESRRGMSLYWGARKLSDLYMLQLPQQWQREHDNFKFIPVLSEALPEDRWQGRSGLVHQAVMDDFADLSNYQVYACGAPVMVEAARRDFAATRNLSMEEFYSDSFTFSNDPKTA